VKRAFSRGGSAKTGVTADASTAHAPAMTTARRCEGDFDGVFTHTSRHGSDWLAQP
jgi:hypothetical protein